MSKVEIKIRINKEKIIKELDKENTLTKIREELLDDITFPFIFCNDDDEDIPKEKESNMKLDDILVGKNLKLKKEKINRKI